MPELRIWHEHTAYIRDAALPLIWTSPGAYGDSRRKRVRPESIKIDWHRDPDGDWCLFGLLIIGQYVHARSSLTLSVRYVDGGRVLREIPLWMGDLIALAGPKAVAA